MTKPCIAVLSSGLPLAKELDAAIAARFGREGFRCLLFARDIAWLQQTCVALRGQGIECEPLTLDLSNLASLQVLLGGMAAGHYISVLAGSVGLAAAQAATLALLPTMRARGNGTLLFRLSDSNSQSPQADAQLRNWAQSLRAELLPSGVQVAAVTVEATQANLSAIENTALHAEHCWQLHVQKPEPLEGR